MSYNDADTAKAITGVEVSTTLLSVAQSVIHSYTIFRWSATAVTRRFSGNNNRKVYLGYPITTWGYLYEVDQENSTTTTLTRYSDYDVAEETGILDISGGSYNMYFPESKHYEQGAFVKGYNNYEVNYTYGYTSSNDLYNVVLFIEAAIALELKKNPLLLQSVRLTGGDTVTYGDNPIHKLLLNIPNGKTPGVNRI